MISGIITGNKLQSVGPVGPLGSLGTVGPLEPFAPLDPFGPVGSLGPVGALGLFGSVWPVGSLELRSPALRDDLKERLLSSLTFLIPFPDVAVSTVSDTLKFSFLFEEINCT